MSVFVALIATLAFESPIVIIEKLIFGAGKKPQKSEKARRNRANGGNNVQEKLETKSNEQDKTHL